MAVQDEPPFLQKLVKDMPYSWYEWLRDIWNNVNLKLEIDNLKGTENQIIVTTEANDAGVEITTLSTPQDIDTEADLRVGSIIFGDPEVEGVFRLIPSGNNLNIERRESSAWVKKGAFRP